MKSTNWKDIAELAGIAAIVASLVFVGIETRNSTQQAILTNRALEIAAYQELMDNIAEMNLMQMQDAALAALMLKDIQSPEELTELERFQMSRVYFLRLRHGDIAFFQYERGAIDESRLRSALHILRLGSPEMKAFWKRNKNNFVEAYRVYIDNLIDEIETESARN